MGSGTFMELIGDNYNEVVTLFKSISNKKGINFDEDSFSDAFIKCANRFKDEIISYETATRYFYKAYINTVKSQFALNDKFNYIEIEEIQDNIIYNEDSSEFYIEVMDLITSKFGKEDMQLYSLYKLHNWTIEEIEEADIDCTDFEKRIKKINKFIKSHYKKH